MTRGHRPDRLRPDRHRPWPDRWPDERRRRGYRGHGGAGMATVVSLVQVLGAEAAARDDPSWGELTYGGAAILLAGSVALAWRRRYPVPVLAVVLAATLAYALSGYPQGPFFLAATVAYFAAVRAGRRVPALVLTGAAVTAYLVCGWWFWSDLGVPARASLSPRDAVLTVVWAVVVFLAGEFARARSAQLAEMAKMRAEQQRARDEQQRRQASEERLRIARELHDVLGHHLSLINVQAGVGLHLIDNRPEQAREALSVIKTASAEALREVRSVLAALRPAEEAAPRAPAPGLDRLSELTSGAGLPVATEVTGARRPLPAEVDRAAYRIVQEALTNVRRHAGPGASATVSVAYLPGRISLTITDDGAGAAGVGAVPGATPTSGPAAAGNTADPLDRAVAGPSGGGASPSGDTGTAPSGGAGAAPRGGGTGPSGGAGAVPSGNAAEPGGDGGNGIAGMRARAAALGGTLVAGPTAKGWRVGADLPDAGQSSR